MAVRSDSSVVRGTSRLLGNDAPVEPVDRDELIRQGHSAQQVNAIEVQRHQRQVLQAHITRWVMTFLCVLCLLVPTLLGLLIWLIISWYQARKNPERCDAPLIDWVTVVYALKVYHCFLHKYVLLCCCKWNPRQEPPAPAPLRVKLFQILFPTFDFAWNIVGIVMTLTSETCETEMPSLYKSILSYAFCGLFFSLFIVVNTVGIQAIFAYMLRNGMLHNEATAAPAGTLEAQEIVAFKPEDFGDNDSCPVCLEEFNAKTEIRRTSCGHCFHTTCLKGWLQLNRTCPLCRTDLASPGGAGAAELGRPSEDVQNAV